LVADLSAAAGFGRLVDLESKGDQHPTVMPITVEAVEPPTRFAFRWIYPQGVTPRAGNSILG
jgi:uncharacterized protein YndB with AHSA1/START domain